MARVEHYRGFYGGVWRVGGTATYIEVDTTNKRIRVYVDSILVKEWS